ELPRLRVVARRREHSVTQQEGESLRFVPAARKVVLGDLPCVDLKVVLSHRSLSLWADQRLTGKRHSQSTHVFLAKKVRPRGWRSLTDGCFHSALCERLHRRAAYGVRWLVAARHRLCLTGQPGLDQLAQRLAVNRLAFESRAHGFH